MLNLPQMNVRKRAVVKKEMWRAGAAGNEVLRINKKNEQNAVKTLNNGMSGILITVHGNL
ncbi:hypothetical protein N5V81_14195 [Escherichia coli]|nr:hypothetical protein [Escherichia coli]